MFPAFYKLFPRVSYVDRLLFTKHMAIMIKSGISLLDALDTLREQTKSKAFAASEDTANALDSAP